jgi:hypothetical protein
MCVLCPFEGIHSPRLAPSFRTPLSVETRIRNHNTLQQRACLDLFVILCSRLGRLAARVVDVSHPLADAGMDGATKGVSK